MQYESISLPDGLRIVHMPSTSPVSYCGFMVDAGTRDEKAGQYGMAHFIEHLLFKGTRKRKAWHILNRMECVGGELNAYTNKEETVIYSVCLSEDMERAVELLSDLVCRSVFPRMELEKEREVVLEEISSYEDNPAELIYDDFENMLFDGHQIGHHILGDARSLNAIDQAACLDFYHTHYRPENMVFFSYGSTPFGKLRKMLEKYMQPEASNTKQPAGRVVPSSIPPSRLEFDKSLHQTHVMIGGQGYGFQDPRRMALYLLNNILGGPGMNSRLNLSLREKNGLVYSVDSGLTTYSDCGIFHIYFGCDSDSKDKCLRLVNKELKNLRDNKLTSLQLAAAKKQIKGQLGISSTNMESVAMSLGKSILRLGRYDSLAEVHAKIDSQTAEGLWEVANEIFSEGNLSRLVFC